MPNVSINLQDSFKAYDVRGIVDKSINAEAVEAIGAAFVDVLELAGEKVLVGGDMRPTSSIFADAFARGASHRGANVVMLGLISTDELYFASGKYDAAGVVFTASHNPAEYNGIKMSKSGARPVSSENGLFDIRDLAQTYLADGIPTLSFEMIGQVQEQDVLIEYSNFLRELVDLSKIRPLKVVVDAGNGMAGLTVPAVLGDAHLPGLPLEILPLYFELDGTFPNHPANPLEPENLRDLQATVLKYNADLGLAFDGDADRCFVIDERGLPLSPSAITALVATREITRVQEAGEKYPTVIHNLITSRAVPEFVEKSGGIPVMTRVGHSFIKAEMAKHKAVFGGEHSAHYYFRDFYNADTGMLAAMHVLAALGEQDLPLSELGAEYEPYTSTGEINSVVDDKVAAVARVVDFIDPTLVVVTELDGTTFAARDGGWWFNLRPSNTEPFLRFNGESREPGVIDKVAEEVLSIVRLENDTISELNGTSHGF